MRVYQRELITTVVLSVVFCFMLFLYEPVVMYLSNAEDFWFDLPTMMGPVLVVFGLSLVVLLALMFGLFFILKKKKKVFVYDYTLAIVALMLIYCYIQGNFLAGFLPILDGSPINWNALLPNFVSIALLALFVAVFIILVKKKLIQKSIKVFMWVAVAIFVMLTLSLIPMLMNQDSTEGGALLYPSTNNLNTASTDKNFMFLVVDATDSRIFSERLSQNEEYKDMLNDFTYYPDTISAYPFTRESMPMLLTGEWYESQVDFDEFSTDAYNNSEFLNNIYKDGYDINLYSDSIIWNKVDNIEIANWLPSTKIRKISFIKQELKYILFKYLPYPLKRFSRIQSFDMGIKNVAEDAENGFTEDDIDYYNSMVENMKLEKQDKKMFSFVHIEGAHIPFDLDGDLNWTDNGTYEDKIDATITIIAKYLERLKENDVYDNSVIIIGADHGYNPTTAVPGRQNPILFIKGMDEHHHEMKVSNRPVSEAEYVEAYERLLDGKSGEEAFGDSEYPKSRRYLEYLHTEVNHLIELEQTGKAWDLSTMKPTGVEYNR